MTRFNENQKDNARDNNAKDSFSLRNGNSNIHFRKGPDGRFIQVVRPAFIKISKLG